MNDIKNVKLVECAESRYVKPFRMIYEQAGKEKTWDLIEVLDSVNIIIFNVTRQVLVLVKQFRPAAFYSAFKRSGCKDFSECDPSQGIMIETCGGILDKDKSAVEIAREEVLEECGYSVPVSAFEKVTSYNTNVGVQSPRQILYYVEVNDSMKVSSGGGNPDEGEFIKVIEMDLSSAFSLIYDESTIRSLSLIMHLLWFFQNKHPKYIKKLNM